MKFKYRSIVQENMHFYIAHSATQPLFSVLSSRKAPPHTKNGCVADYFRIAWYRGVRAIFCQGGR